MYAAHRIAQRTTCFTTASGETVALVSEQLYRVRVSLPLQSTMTTERAANVAAELAAENTDDPWWSVVVLMPAGSEKGMNRHVVLTGEPNHGPGQLWIPGGKRATALDTETNPRLTAVREVQEETGVLLDVADLNLFGVLDVLEVGKVFLYEATVSLKQLQREMRTPERAEALVQRSLLTPPLDEADRRQKIPATIMEKDPDGNEFELAVAAASHMQPVPSHQWYPAVHVHYAVMDRWREYSRSNKWTGQYIQRTHGRSMPSNVPFRYRPEESEVWVAVDQYMTEDLTTQLESMNLGIAPLVVWHKAAGKLTPDQRKAATAAKLQSGENPEALDNWLLKQPSMLSSVGLDIDDPPSILFVSMQIEGPLQTWWTAYDRKPAGDRPKNFKEFDVAVRKSTLMPDIARDAMLNLFKLRQSDPDAGINSTYRQYVLQFNEMLARTRMNYPEEPLCLQFSEGMSNYQLKQTAHKHLAVQKRDAVETTLSDLQHYLDGVVQGQPHLGQAAKNKGKAPAAQAGTSAEQNGDGNGQRNSGKKGNKRKGSGNGKPNPAGKRSKQNNGNGSGDTNDGADTKYLDLYRKLTKELGRAKVKEHFEKKQCLNCHKVGHVLKNCPDVQ